MNSNLRQALGLVIVAAAFCCWPGVLFLIVIKEVDLMLTPLSDPIRYAPAVRDLVGLALGAAGTFCGLIMIGSSLLRPIEEGWRS